MSCLAITQFRDIESPKGTEKYNVSLTGVSQVLLATEGLVAHSSWSIGTDVSDRTCTQLITEWNDQREASHDKLRGIESSLAGTRAVSTFRVGLNKSAFLDTGAGSANIYECVQSFFPVSAVTPQFKRTIEQDFVKFDGIYGRDGVKGSTEAVFGWSLDEQDHEDIQGGKAIGFFVIRGWDTMRNFELSLQTDNYKESIPILYGWNAPFKMVSHFLCKAQFKLPI